MSSILGAWLDQYSEDFWSPPDYGCLHQLLSYLHKHFPGSDLERRAHNLLAHFHRRQVTEPDPDGRGQGSAVRGQGSGLRLDSCGYMLTVHERVGRGFIVIIGYSVAGRG